MARRAGRRGNPAGGNAGAGRGGKPAGPKPQRLPDRLPPSTGLKRRVMTARRRPWQGVGVRALFMAALSLIVSAAVLLVTERPVPGVEGTVFSAAVVAFVLAVGLLFDMVGVAVAAATPGPFHARAARSHAGAAQSLRLIRHADQVANFCLDFVGDVSGTLTGALATGAVYRLAGSHDPVVWAAIAVGAVAGTNVGLKAFAKAVALSDSVTVVRLTGEVLFWSERLGAPPVLAGRRRRPQRPRRAGGRRGRRGEAGRDRS